MGIESPCIINNSLKLKNSIGHLGLSRYSVKAITPERILFLIFKVLPFLVERKSWEDFRESVRTKRFQKQVNHMLVRFCNTKEF